MPLSTRSYPSLRAAARPWLVAGALSFSLLARPAIAWAQAGCLLVPVPLAERTQQATLVVEARVVAQQAEHRAGSSAIVTRQTLEIFKVFRGQLPAGEVSLLTPGGTVGLRREVVSGTLTLGVGQQGIFFLEPDPDSPGELRPYAGPQGFIAYDLPTRTAAEPFARYAAIDTELYPALARLSGQAYQAVRPNADLRAAQARAAAAAAQRPAATPVLNGFSPAAVTAGTSTSTSTSANGVLTLTGSGFNAVRGAGYVTFRSADAPTTTTRPLDDDYLSWTDTQIQVRVPAASASGNAAGTGPVRVVNSDGNAAATASDLTVTYALSSVSYNSQNYRPHLVGTGETGNAGGYVLHYAASLPAAAQAPFEAALTSWRCQAGANRSLGAAASQGDVASSNGESVVRFGSLSTGVLGVTASYYSACSVGSGPLSWELTETDYSFSTSTNWYYGTGTPGTSQYDFQSVALHELGHGIQLTHIISSTGVMNYAIGNGQTRRTLDSNTDLAAARDVTSYSTGASSDELCGYAAYAPSSASCALPVALVAFTARNAGGTGTALAWTTASEQHAAYFAVESQEPGAAAWQEVLRTPAAGSSATTRQYQALDARPLAGTRYYRLRQVDQDGTATYSPTVAVQGQATALTAYPNPATGRVHLSGPLAAGAAARAHLLDALGRCVRQAAGPAGQAALDVSLAGLAPGLYVLVWDGGTGPRRQQLVVE